ncbi:MoxR-like ATPase [Desulfomicrobium macestii]|uniref:MoxR-like ATPase n=1 Tax=Desulfomicrobium macestii TaxID=90731 RepID=A0ABR9H6C5_9BACT|nr:MoxR family ATPase [Desulfomicrobium macestii]MBE1426266.1 MoxR-like ATPase [Desulfomicrobium macestii]
MKPSSVMNALETLIHVQQPVFLWGAPGVGKSQVVAQAAKRLGLELVDVRAVLLDPVDLRGIPRIDDNGNAIWCPPSFLPRQGRGVLFLDELNTAPPLVQAACYQLILDRKLGEYTLPDGWTVIAAGNRESDRSVTHRMPTALANRLVHLDFEPDLDDWLAWAEGAGIDARLCHFLRFRPKLLHSFDPTRAEKAFPSPRSWEFVSRILGAGTRWNTLRDLLKGAVGEAAAAECMGFLKVHSLMPDVEQVLADPGGVALPGDPAVLYAMCEALARRASELTMNSLAVLASRLPVEFGVLLMRDAAGTDPDIVETDAFQIWACANSDVLVTA